MTQHYGNSPFPRQLAILPLSCSLSGLPATCLATVVSSLSAAHPSAQFLMALLPFASAVCGPLDNSWSLASIPGSLLIDSLSCTCFPFDTPASPTDSVSIIRQLTCSPGRRLLSGSYGSQWLACKLPLSDSSISLPLAGPCVRYSSPAQPLLAYVAWVLAGSSAAHLLLAYVAWVLAGLPLCSSYIDSTRSFVNRLCTVAFLSFAPR